MNIEQILTETLDEYMTGLGGLGDVYIDEEGYPVDDYTIEDEEQYQRDWELVVIEIGFDKIFNTESEEHWNQPIYSEIDDDDLPF